MSFEQKMEKAKQNKLKREGVVHPKIKPKSIVLSEGQKNILFADIIDKVWAKGGGFPDAYILITNYFENVLKTPAPAHSRMWELAARAKDLWLTNFNLPSLENYRKEQLNKALNLEMEVKTKSKKDIVDKSKAIIDIFRYTDKIVGIDDNSGIDVAISINTPTSSVIKALEIQDVEVQDVSNVYED